MTIATTTQRSAHTGTGSNDDLAVGFKFYASSDLVVIKRVTATGVETTLTISTHYTVTGGNGATGTVTVVDGSTDFTTDDTWTILRASPQTQTLDLVENDAFPAESVEASLDKLSLQIQDLQEQLNRSLKFPISDLTSLSPEIPSSFDRATADAVMTFNASTGAPEVSTALLAAITTTAFSLTLLDDADAVTMRATLLLDNLRSVASANTIAVTLADVALTITGSTDVRNLTGGTAGQKLTLHWAASATFTVDDANTGAGEIHLHGNLDLEGQLAGHTLSLISDGTDWFETSRSSHISGSRLVSGANSIAVTAADRVLGVSGSTILQNLTGGVPGQLLTIWWIAAAFFDVEHLAGGAGQIVLVGNVNTGGFRDLSSLTLVRSPSSDVWQEVSRSKDENITAFTELTVAAGVLAGVVNRHHYVDTQDDDATDDLDTITATEVQVGQELTLFAANDARTVTIKDASGNIIVYGGDLALDNTNDGITMVWDGTNWLAHSRHAFT